ncbi:MAG: addiction module toxin RelE [Bacteroidales bacterium]
MPRDAQLLTFVETSMFTRRIALLELDDALRDLQLQLLDNPEAGEVDPGTGGLRKIRMAEPARQKGKRGGARIHYLWLARRKTIYLIFVYSKAERATLTAVQKARLREVVKEIKQAGGRA